MASFLLFLLIAGVPLSVYIVNALRAMKERGDLGNRGIAAGIPKPKQARAPKNRTRGARVRQRRAVYCGRDFTHLALAVLGSQDSCRHCTYLQAVPPPPDSDDDEPVTDSDAAVRAAEEIIDKAQQ